MAAVGKRVRVLLVVWLGAMLAMPVSAADAVQIDALALFPGMAVLRINGQQLQLRAGEESPQGVRLLSSSSKEAVVSYQGNTQRLNLSSAISARFAAPVLKRVIIAPDSKRHYFTTGSINQLPVRFMVDTGATNVAMSALHAERLGISFRMQGEPSFAQTAAGVVPTYRVRLDQVQVGEITLQNVEGTVIEGAYPAEILLGMSFLRHVKMQEVDGTLHLLGN